MATGLENLVPTGQASSFDSDVGSVICFTQIQTRSHPTLIKHLWFHGDRFVMEISLPVKSFHWRTYSTKTILPSSRGVWRVDVTSEDGTILKTLNFSIQ